MTTSSHFAYNCHVTFDGEGASKLMTEIEQDRALMERIRAGDKSACDDCVRRHAPGVYRLALRIMRNGAEAEDVMQDAFLSAFKGIEQFDGRSSLRTWLYRIAYNAAMMRLRKRKPEWVSVDESGRPAEGMPLPTAFFDWSSLPDEELEKEEVREMLESAIADLPENLQAVFVLREMEELSTLETAKALRVSQEAVKTRLHRARLWLRERLTSYFDPRPKATRRVTS